MKSAILLLSIMTYQISGICDPGPAHFQAQQTPAKIAKHLKARASAKSVPSAELANAIFKLCKLYDVSQSQVVSVLLTESRGVASAVNEDTEDYGIMQINIKTAEAQGVTKECLMNWRCNLKVGIKLISELNNLKDFKICMYNTGRAGAKKYKKTCDTYTNKLTKEALND